MENFLECPDMTSLRCGCSFLEHGVHRPGYAVVPALQHAPLPAGTVAQSAGPITLVESTGVGVAGE